MAGLKAIKNKIRSVEKTGKVTKAMEAVSAAKMRKAQTRALSGRAYARAASGILARVSGSNDLKKHPLSVVRPIKKALYLVIVADRGLAGALNSGVLRATLADMRASNLLESACSVIAIGRKANDFFVARGITVEEFYPNADDASSGFIRELVDKAAKRFGTGAVVVVKIAYQNFFSTFEQHPTIHTIFPLSLEELEGVVADILPVRGAFAEPHEKTEHPSTYAIEPSEAEVFDSIVPRLASIFVFHALLESQASEHSARMVAMKSASDKAEEMTQALTLKFNKARQAAITREVSEITGGMEAMAI
ncbi:MAG: ATP synthase F1 subunit gamma [Candidatus Adlerbacteria bacterium]|nr:ATP synthase F1 subunit gamma [Candidatus Adlerbacteria bacterium]